jgi:hypothetical protein
VFESENIMGGDINSHTCNSTVACAAACCNEPRCNAFTLDVRKARCWLKDGHRTPVQKDGCTSGNVTAHRATLAPPTPKATQPSTSTTVTANATDAIASREIAVLAPIVL